MIERIAKLEIHGLIPLVLRSLCFRTKCTSLRIEISLAWNMRIDKVVTHVYFVVALCLANLKAIPRAITNLVTLSFLIVFIGIS